MGYSKIQAWGSCKVKLLHLALFSSSLDGPPGLTQQITCFNLICVINRATLILLAAPGYLHHWQHTIGLSPPTEIRIYNINSSSTGMHCHYWPVLSGIYRWFPHKGPVTLKLFPCYDVVMAPNLTCIIANIVWFPTDSLIAYVNITWRSTQLW